MRVIVWGLLLLLFIVILIMALESCSSSKSVLYENQEQLDSLLYKQAQEKAKDVERHMRDTLRSKQ